MGKTPLLNRRALFTLFAVFFATILLKTPALADLTVDGTVQTGGYAGQSVAIAQSINLQYYMTAPNDGMLVVYDDFSNSTQTVLLNGGTSTPWDLDVYENGGSPKLYITDKNNFKVFVYDVMLASVSTTFTVGNTPTGIAVDNTNSRVYVCNYNSNHVSVYNTTTDTYIGLLTSGMSKPYGVAVNETTDRVYISNYDTGYIFVFESSTGNYVTQIQAMAKPTNLTVNETDDKVYVVHDGVNYISIIDGATETSSPLSIPSWGQDIAYLPDLGIYFVVSPATGMLYGFDAEDDEQIQDSPLTVGSAPTGIAVREDGINAGAEPWVLVTANSTDNTMSEVTMYDTYAPKFLGLTSATDAGDGVTPTVTLVWAAASDISPPITYNVYTTATSGVYDFNTPSWTTGSSGVVSYATAGLNYGDHVYFTVRAEDSAITVNEDANVIEFGATVTDGAAPTGGDILTAVDTTQGKEVQLTWSAGADTTLPITYNIYRSTMSGVYDWYTPTYSTETVTTYTISGLTNNTTYYFTVRAEDGAGLENSNVTELSATPTDAVAPTFAGISNLADDMTGAALNLSWAAASDNSTPVTYNIYYEAGASVTSYVTPADNVSGQTNYQITGLTNNVLYTVVVRAEDTAGNEDGNFVSLSATPTDSIVPVFGGVQYCGDKGNGDGIRVYWQDATDNSIPISYNVYYATQSGVINYNFASWSYQTDTVDYTASGLTQGQDYYFIVRAEDASGLEESNTVEVGPCAPTDGSDPVFSGLQSATATWTPGEVLLEWTAATDDSPPIIYNIYESLISGGQNYSSASYQTTNASYTVSGLVDGTDYYYVVRAEDAGKREDSNTTQIMATPNDGVLPVFAGVTGVSDAGTYGALDVSWGAASDSTLPITYNVYTRTSSGSYNFSSPASSTTATSAIVTGLDNGTMYYVVVRASDGGGLTEKNVVESSGTPSDSTGPTFAGITSVTDTKSGGQLKLMWSPATDPSGPITYPIYMSAGTSTIDYSTPVYTALNSPYYVDNLSGSQTYWFSVGAKDSALAPNTATNAVVISGTPTDASPPVFSGVKTATSASGQSKTIRLTWDAATDYSTPVTYSIYHASSNVAALILAGGVQATTTQVTYDVTGLTNGVFRYFIVRAEDTFGNKETNTTVKGAVPADWSAPTFSGLGEATNTGNGGEVQLTWSAATDEASIVYNIYYSLATSTLLNSVKSTSTSLSHTVTGLTDNSVYYFAVGAEDQYGNETTNDVIFATSPTDTAAPVFSSSPAAADTTVGGETLITWGAASDNSSPVTYNIYQALSTSSFTFGTPTYSTQGVTSYEISGLTDNQPYYYVVTATDSSSNANESSTATVLTVTPTDQTAPEFSGLSSVTLYSENGIVLLSWSAATDRTEPVTYNIFKTSIAGSYSGYASANYVVSGTTTYLVSGLVDTKRYYFTVRAQDAVTPTPNADANTNEKGITFIDNYGPEKPTNVAAIGGDPSPATNDQYIMISWTPPTKNADAQGTTLFDLEGYNIYRGTTSGSYDLIVNQVDGVLNGYVPAASSSYIDTYNITDNVLYYYIVVAVDDANTPNESAPSDQVSAKTKNSDIAVPRPPENLTATPASGQVTLTWNAPEFNEDGSPLTDLQGYYIWRSETSGGVYISVGGVIPDTDEDYLDTNVVNDTTYYYYMTAIDGGGTESAASNEVSAKPAANIDYPPAAPTNLVATTGDAIVYLSWSPPTTNSDGSAIGSDLAGYNVFRAEGASTQPVQLNSSIVTSPSYNDGDISTGIMYTYYVVAEDKAGQKSATSTEAIAIIGTKGVTGRIRVRMPGAIQQSGYDIVGVALLEVQLVDDQGTVVATGYTSSDGTYKIIYEDAVSSTPYSIRLVVEEGSGYPYTVKNGSTGYLTLVEDVFITSGFTSITPDPPHLGIASTVGDVNCDGSINIYDVAAIKPVYNSSSGDEDYNISMDMNGDGKINIFDIAVLKGYYGKKTMTPPDGTCN